MSETVNKKYKWLMLLALFFPPLTAAIFDPVFSLFSAPFLFVVGCVGAFLIDLIFKKLQASKENSIKTIFFFSLTLSAYLGYFLSFDQTAEGIFRRVVTDELPEDIVFIDSKGYVPLAGGSEVVVFSIASDSFLKTVSDLGFKECSLEEISNVHYSLDDIKKYSLIPTHVYRKSYLPESPHMSGVLIFTDEERNLFYLYRWKI